MKNFKLLYLPVQKCILKEQAAYKEAFAELIVSQIPLQIFTNYINCTIMFPNVNQFLCRFLSLA